MQVLIMGRSSVFVSRPVGAPTDVARRANALQGAEQ